MKKQIEFIDLKTADLIKDTIYKGGPNKDLSSEPISKLLPVGNQSGIRIFGKADNPILVVLYTTLLDKDWPDKILNDKVEYFGDNKTPGKEIHELLGNKVLKTIFNKFYLSNKREYPPIFLFIKGKFGYDRIFKGLLKPGYKDLEDTEDLIAIWKTKNNERFQNYKAVFTILSKKSLKELKLTN